MGGQDGFIPVITKDMSQFYSAYVDITFDNGETMDAFNALEPYARKGIVLPIPIVNAEYYYVKQCTELGLVYNSTAVDACLHFKPYLRVARVKNFEKFCKWCAYNALRECALLKRPYKFITQSCPCEYPKDDIQSQLLDKSHTYSRLYPLAPARVGLSIVEAATRVHQMCEDLNTRFGLAPELFTPDPVWYSRWQAG